MILERFKVPAKDQVHVSEAALRATVTQIFEKLGLSPQDAAEGADVLTMTDLRGVETHGVSNMLRMYVRDYKAGKLDPRPGWKIVRQSPGTAVIDGYTVAHDHGAPTYAAVVARTSGGERVAARGDDAGLAAAMVTEEWCGREIQVRGSRFEA